MVTRVKFSQYIIQAYDTRSSSEYVRTRAIRRTIYAAARTSITGVVAWLFEIGNARKEGYIETVDGGVSQKWIFYVMAFGNDKTELWRRL